MVGILATGTMAEEPKRPAVAEKPAGLRVTVSYTHLTLPTKRIV